MMNCKELAKDYKESELQIKTYWRWGAFYLITFNDGSSAFVRIDFSYNGREYCAVDSMYNKQGDKIFEDKNMETLISFIMSEDELNKHKNTEQQGE
jgi:hypothetical protein